METDTTVDYNHFLLHIGKIDEWNSNCYLTAAQSCTFHHWATFAEKTFVEMLQF